MADAVYRAAANQRRRYPRPAVLPLAVTGEEGRGKDRGEGVSVDLKAPVIDARSSTPIATEHPHPVFGEVTLDGLSEVSPDLDPCVQWQPTFSFIDNDLLK